jgi:flagellar motor switch protein FliN
MTPHDQTPNLTLLLDVELPVSISFGRTLLPIREVLKLSTGSVVELDCAANDPVEVIVNNCTIARGSVVVIDGNYGVRIDEIVSRQDRMLVPGKTFRQPEESERDQ